MIRLLNVDTLKLEEFDEDNTPYYIIASHRWQKNESTLKDVLKNRNTNSAGFDKIRRFCEFIKSWRKLMPPLSYKWLWIDTCCIDKKSSAELSEAINSMYNWYAEAAVCVAYLADVQVCHEVVTKRTLGQRISEEDVAQFQASKWFTRGWTLQELIAPRDVVFVDNTWTPIGHKRGGSGPVKLPPRLIGMELNEILARRTDIPQEVLLDHTALDAVSLDKRLAWMDERQTTRIEDRAYCLLGIFGVHMPLIYGERRLAMTRLLNGILQRQVWRARGLEKHAEDALGQNAEATSTHASAQQNMIETLQDRISMLEMELGNAGPRQNASGKDKFNHDPALWMQRLLFAPQ